jgi:hypothetical protein
VRGFGRTTAVEVKQESALVTAILSGKIPNNSKSFVNLTASKTASSGVLTELCRSNSGVSDG